MQDTFDRAFIFGSLLIILLLQKMSLNSFDVYKDDICRFFINFYSFKTFLFKVDLTQSCSCFLKLRFIAKLLFFKRYSICDGEPVIRCHQCQKALYLCSQCDKEVCVMLPFHKRETWTGNLFLQLITILELNIWKPVYACKILSVGR